MYGHPSRFRPPGGGSGGRGMPTAQPTAPSVDPNFFAQNPNVFLQNPTFPLHQNPNFPLQNPNFPIQNPNFPPQQFSNVGFRPQSHSQNPKEAIDRAVTKARRDLIAAGESVSAWKVSQAALLKLQVDSWSSLGFKMQEVPSLHSLMVTEGKINAFIHCFVGVRRITSMHELQVAICKNEGIETFEELELGPLVRNPLIVHYFSVNSDVAEICEITSEEIISCLCEFMDNHENEHIKAEEFLDFIAEKRHVMGRENLGVRIQSLGMHITFIREARRLENATLKKFVGALKQKSDKRSRKRPLLSTQKKQLDERFSDLSQRIKSFSSVQVDFGGKHIRFVSSSSEDDDSDDHKSVDENLARSHCKSLQSVESCDRVSSCPYPSAIEEMTRLGLKGETDAHYSPAGSSFRHNESNRPARKKRKSENLNCTVSAPTKVTKRDEVKPDFSVDDDNGTEELSNLNEADISLSDTSMRMFITTWKEACRDQNVAEVFERMLQFYNTTARQKKRMKSWFSSYPCLGLLNVAVTSIKRGKWDSIYDTFQDMTQHAFSNTLSDTNSKYESIDVEPSERNALVIEDCISERIHSVAAEDIIRKLATYFELDQVIFYHEKSPLEKKLIFLRKLHNCEVWLTEQFSVKEFKSLGYGEFFTFLENNATLLPTELLKCLIGETCEKSPFEVCMLQHQLVVLLSQASNSLWENKTITKQNISLLLMRQFPLINFNVIENGSTQDFLDIVREKQSSVISNCVLFSLTFLGHVIMEIHWLRMTMICLKFLG
ncbi:hypothetical protein L1049_027291 [Liquidambar formosana]|uniref:Uncharacterized protein n=1 Tax=Liquidambar formosana TaxID=63359 RepID=A0AAP0N879_LIQFO